MSAFEDSKGEEQINDFVYKRPAREVVGMGLVKVSMGPIM